MTRDNILALLNKAPYYSSTERDKKLYLSERERRGRGGKTSVQTITRKLDEKNEVKVVGGIPSASIACCTTYQLAAHRPNSSRKSNLFRGSDQKDRARQMI